MSTTKLKYSIEDNDGLGHLTIDLEDYSDLIMVSRCSKHEGYIIGIRSVKTNGGKPLYEISIQCPKCVVENSDGSS